MVARQLDDLAQVFDHVQQPAVVRNTLQFVVEGLVGLEKGVDVLRAGRFLEVGVNGFQGAEFGLGGATRRASCALSLEHGHDLEHFIQVALGDLGHITAPARLERYQPLGCQHLERFAQRRAGNAVILGQCLLVHPGARLEFVRKDALTQAFCDFLVQRKRGDAGFGHGESGSPKGRRS